MTKDNVLKLRKENDQLKTQLDEFRREMEAMKNKMDSLPPVQDSTHSELEKSMQFLSEEYDDKRHDKSTVQQDLKRLESRFYEIDTKVHEIDEAIESVMRYSYQYNLKLVGVPQASETGETSEQTVDICLKLFTEMGVKISEYDIDIAHRTPNRQQSTPAPIICKFTRRITKESVLKLKKEFNKVDLSKMGLSGGTETYMAIYEHLTPKQQDLLNKAKTFQRQNNFAYCWVKKSNNTTKRESRQ